MNFECRVSGIFCLNVGCQMKNIGDVGCRNNPFQGPFHGYVESFIFYLNFATPTPHFESLPNSDINTILAKKLSHYCNKFYSHLPVSFFDHYTIRPYHLVSCLYQLFLKMKFCWRALPSLSFPVSISSMEVPKNAIGGYLGVDVLRPPVGVCKGISSPVLSMLFDCYKHTLVKKKVD